MTKKDIHRRFIDQTKAELESITAAARKSFATATSDEHRAESKYDTFKLESSYLTRGLAKRVEELTSTVESLQGLPMRKFGKDSPIQVSALVRLRANDGKALTVFLGSGAGGETITVGGEEVNAISSCSPLGLAMQDKRVGDTFDMRIGKTMTSFTVLSVE